MVRAALSSTGPGGGGQDAAPAASSAATGPARSFSLSLQSAASAMHHPPLSSALFMSSPSAAAVHFSSSSTVLGPVVEEARRCRYKTGKCSNARSSKRNGQPHQLCLYHRDKANQIQRKFDRQKRQVLRERKGSSSSLSPSSSRHSHSSTSASGPPSGPHRSHLHLHYSHNHHQFQHKSPLNNLNATASSVRNVTNFAPRFTSLAAKDVDIYSDSDASSRFSTDSSSSDVSSSSMWADLPSPVSATAFMGLLRLTPVAAPAVPVVASPTVSTPTDPRLMITPTATAATAQGHLSHDEIDFLCSAMLE
ncbi:hypothetical protein Gpo141_00002856 [Globisporangium polare]